MNEVNSTLGVTQSAGNTYATEGAGQTAGAEKVVTGSVGGQQVEELTDADEVFMDSMEELAAQFEEKTTKEVGQRRLGKGKALGAKMTEYARAVDKWTRHFADLPSGESIDRLLRQLRQEQSKRMTPLELMRALSRLSSDPSHQWAILEILEKALDRAEDSAVKALVRQTRQKLDDERGAEVRAGINIAQEVNARAESAEQMRDLRDLYRRETLGYKSPQDCFRSLLAERGPKRIKESLEFLLKSCEIDLQSPSPSQSAEELRRIILDLQCVNVLQAALERCEDLASQFPGLYAETCLLDGTKLAQRIVDLTEQPFPSAEDFKSLVEASGLEKLEAKIYFNTQVIEVLRGLSPRLFAEDGDRIKLIEAAQENLDELIREEQASGEGLKPQEAGGV